MHIDDIVEVTDLMRELQKLAGKLEYIKRAGFIHMEFGISRDTEHVHFDVQDEDFDAAQAVVKDVLEAQVTVLKDKLKGLGVIIQ